MSSRSCMALLIAVILTVSLGLPALAAPPANQHFQRTWARTDQPVASSQVSRTWMWGPEGYTGEIQENYQEAPGGVRTVQYFDKSRMEITNPGGDPNSIWYVTNGLLVMELLTGKMQLGDAYFANYSPANVNIAGDSDDPTGPTYATFGSLIEAPAADGAILTYRIDRDGNVTDDPSLAVHNVYAAHHVVVPNIDRQVASVFWTFMNSTGTVYENGSFTVANLFQDPFYATGYPITEAYWANVKVGGTYQDVLMQCFERRCLTYNPANPAGWKVEAGNVGQHYHYWRYVQVPNDEEEPLPPPPAAEYEFLNAFGSEHDPANDIGIPAGLELGENGRLYVVDYDLNRVQMYSAHGLFIGSWGMHGTNNSEFDKPRDVAIDRFGNVFVTDQDNHRVQRFTADGAYLGQFGSAGNGVGQFTLVDGIAIGSNDVVYVADRGAHRILMFTLAGNYIGEWGIEGDGNGEFFSPSRIAVDNDNNVYVTDQGNHRVQKFDEDGTYIGQWGEFGEDPGEFRVPVGIEILNTNGGTYVLVIDYLNHRFQWFETDGGFLGTQGIEGSGMGEYLHPFSIAFGPNDSMYIGEAGNNRIQVSLNDGGDRFFIDGDGRGRFGTPMGIAFDASGNVLVGDSLQSMIQKFYPDGTLRNVLPLADAPHAVATAPNSLIYSVSATSQMVTASDGTGTIVDSWGGNGAGNGQFIFPLGIDADSNSNIYVVDAGLNRVQKFASNGTYLTQWGTVGHGDGEFDTPLGIAIYQDKVYVADGLNHRIQIFSTSGDYIGQFGSFGSGEGQFDIPSDVAVDEAGFLYVTDSENNRVQKFDPEGNFLTEFGEYGSGNGQFMTPYALDVAANGNVYVVDANNYRIQVFKQGQ